MAKTAFVDILPEQEKEFFTGIKSSDRFVFSRVIKKVYMFSIKKKKGVLARSLLPQIAAIWATFDEATKLAWVAAGNIMGLNTNPHNPNATIAGWRLFVQDQTIRILNSISGQATPVTTHQSWAGNLHIETPASELKILQIHPHFYWISQKVKGKKRMYEPVLITEDLFLPFTLSLNYKANLIPTGEASYFGTRQYGFFDYGYIENEFAKFFAKFWHSYQGVDLHTDLEIPLEYQTDWCFADNEITELETIIIRYDLYFHISGLQGDVYFDNIKATHSSQNWARDPFCKDINQGFTRAFYQIPKHWAGVILPEGSSFDSMYPET